MAAAICLSGVVTSAQSDATSSWTNVTGASIPSGGGSGQLVVGRKYWITVFAQQRGDAGGQVAFGRLLHGSTAFAESEQVQDGSDGTTRLLYQFQTVWEAVSGEGLQFQHMASSGQTVNSDQVVVLALDLSELTENTDYFWNELATDGGLSTTPLNGATVTFTPGSSDQYLVSTYAQIQHGDTTTRAQSVMVRSGEASSTAPLGRKEVSLISGLTNYQGTLLFRGFSLTAASNTFTERSEASSGTAHTRTHSSVFVLRLGAWDQVQMAFTEGTEDMQATTDYADALQSVSLTPNVTGDFLAFASFTYDAAISRNLEYRLQMAGADQPGTQTSDNYSFLVRDTDEYRPYGLAVKASLTSGASRTIAVEGSVTNATGPPQCAHRSLIVFSLELGGATDTTPGAPTWNTSNGLTLSTTPSLEFTGTDAEGHTLEYEVEITDNHDAWANGDIKTDEQPDSGGSSSLTIHTNPVGGTTWEGHNQVDDRPGQVWKAKGGKLKDWKPNFSAFESNPSLTNGSYLISVYGVDSGIRGDSTIAVWAASTVYSLGAKVKNTSTANANQQFLYVCTTAGTSGGTEPSWTEVEDATFSDNTVVWTAHRGAGPLNPATAANTPTPNWWARSDVTSYNPGAVDGGLKSNIFSGANHFRTTRDAYYCSIVDWRPINTTSDNGITVKARIGSAHNGNLYIDGASTPNNGPRVGDDLVFEAYETFILSTRTSSTHTADFVNTVDGGDTSPFTSGQKVRWTAQTALDAGVNYRARVRCRDTNGTNTWSAWSSDLTFTTASGKPRYYYAQQQG